MGLFNRKPDPEKLCKEGMKDYKAKEYAKALECFKQSAEQGHPIAQNNLASLYYKGDGVEQDYAKAAGRLEKAATQGFNIAQYGMAVMFQNGHGVERDLKKASEWAEKALAGDMEDAKELLAEIRKAEAEQAKGKLKKF